MASLRLSVPNSNIRVGTMSFLGSFQDRSVTKDLGICCDLKIAWYVSPEMVQKGRREEQDSVWGPAVRPLSLQMGLAATVTPILGRQRPKPSKVGGGCLSSEKRSRGGVWMQGPRFSLITMKMGDFFQLLPF